MKKQTILLTVFTLLVILAFTCFIFINNQAAPVDSDLNTASTSESVLTSTTTTGGVEISSSTINSTQGFAPGSFKVYENKDFGISFKYPNDWKTLKLEESEEFFPTVFVEKNGQKISMVKNGGKEPYISRFDTGYEEYEANDGQTVRVWKGYDDGKLVRYDARVKTCESIAIFVTGTVESETDTGNNGTFKEIETFKEIIKSINCF